MMEEKNQATKPWGFDSSMQELHYGIKILANKKMGKITDLQDGGLSWKMLESEDNEDEETQKVFNPIS